MAESKYLIKKCTLIPNESSLPEDKPYDLVRGVAAIDYYEDIQSPTIGMTVTFIDVDQVIGREGITGGEYIDVTVLDGDEDEFIIDSTKQKMILNSVRNMVTESNKQVATLEFVSVESIINETARVNKKFTGNVSQIVFELLKGGNSTTGSTRSKESSKFLGLQTSKNLDKDEASNSYTFVGNLKRPFDTIQWLCPKAQASTNSFGFLFYETLDGYHFRSIKSLLEQEAIPYQQADRPIEGNKILQNNLEQTNDIGINLRLGMYANRTIFVDIENHTLKTVNFDIDQLKDIKKKPKLLKKINEHPSRLMLKINDVGVAQKGSKKEDTQPESELDVYKNKSYIRNNLLFGYSISISIPLNTTLRAGFIIDLKFPLKDEDGDQAVDEYGNEKTNDPSGRYLISRLRHLIGGGKGETQLTLVRDVFTA